MDYQSDCNIYLDLYQSETIATLKFLNIQYFSSGSFCQINRVTDEALIAETTVWPNFFLMNVFFALKGSKLFIIIPLVKIKMIVPKPSTNTLTTSKQGNCNL